MNTRLSGVEEKIKEHVSGLDERVANLRGELDSLASRLEGKQDTVHGLVDRLARMEVNSGAFAAGLVRRREEVTLLDNRCTALEASCFSAEELCGMLEKMQQETANQHNKCMGQIGALRGTLNRLADPQNPVGESIESVIARIQALENRLKSSSAEDQRVNQLLGELSSLRSKVDRECVTRAEWSLSAENGQRSLAAAEKRFGDAIKEMRQKGKDAPQRLKSEERIEALATKVSALEDENRLLRNDVAALTEKYDRLGKQSDVLRRCLNGLFVNQIPKEAGGEEKEFKKPTIDDFMRAALGAPPETGCGPIPGLHSESVLRCLENWIAGKNPPNCSFTEYNMAHQETGTPPEELRKEIEDRVNKDLREQIVWSSRRSRNATIPIPRISYEDILRPFLKEGYSKGRYYIFRSPGDCTVLIGDPQSGEAQAIKAYWRQYYRPVSPDASSLAQPLAANNEAV